MDRITQSFSSTATVDFHYDLASNLVKESYQKQSGPNQAGDRFAYDEHHRLWKAWLGSDASHLGASDPEAAVGTFVQKQTYGLDAANNRTAVTTQAGPSGSPSVAAYSTQDQGEPQGPSNRYDIAAGSAPVYDQRGNTIFDGNLYYVYDDLNRLSEVYVLATDADASAMASQPATSSARVAHRRQQQAARGPFTVPDVGTLRAARTRLLQRVSGGAREIVRRHREAGFVQQLREAIPARDAFRAAAPSSGAQAASAASAGAGDATLEPLAYYLYDAGNRRVARIVVGVQTWFAAWDGWSEAQELVLGVDGGAVVCKPERQFVWGEQLDELVAYRYRQPGQGAFASFFVAEGGAHCPSRVVDAAGAVVEVQEYDPYGKAGFFDGSGVYVGEGTQFGVGNPFQWKGHRVDPETGLTYMRHRYYSSAWGRFLTQDPLGVWGDSASRGNGYAYGGNAPGTHSDPFGLQVMSPFTPFLRNTVIPAIANDYPGLAAYANFMTGIDAGVSEAVGDAASSIAGVIVYPWGALADIAQAALGDTENLQKRFESGWENLKGMPTAIGASVGSLVGDLTSGDVQRTSKGLANVAMLYFGARGGVGAARPVPPAVAGECAGATRAGATAARGATRAIDPNRLHHIFGNAEHALDDFVAASGGREAAFTRIQDAANAALREGRLPVGPSGVLPSGDAGLIIDVAGTQIRLIGGRVVDGVVQIASASRRGLP